MRPDEKYKKAVILNQQKKHMDAFNLLSQAARSHYGKAANTMYSIYKDNLDSPSDETTGKLIAAFIDGFNGGNNSKETLETAIRNLKALEKGIENNNALRGKIYWAQSICYKKTGQIVNQIKTAIKSTILGNPEALASLREFTERSDIRNHLAKIYLACFEYFNTETENEIRILAFLLAQLHKKELKKIGKFGLSQENEAAASFEPNEMKERITNYYNYLILRNNTDENLFMEALNWLETSNEQDDELIQAIDQHVQDNNANILLTLSLGKYYFKNANFIKAKEHLENLYQAEEYSDELKEYQEMLRRIYQDNNNAASINRLDDWISNKSIGDILYQQTMQSDYSETENWHFIDDLKRAAMHKHEPAMIKIAEMAQLNNAYALAARADILEAIGKSISDSKKQLETFSYYKKDSLNKLRAEARKIYEENLKVGNSIAYFEVAKLRYEGRLFEKNFYLARELFAKACSLDCQQARYHYAKMCFYGEGGAIDIEAAEQYLDKNSLSPDINYLLGEIYYWRYLDAELTDHEQKATFFQQAIAYFLRSADKNSKAFLSLVIMHDRDNCHDLAETLNTLILGNQEYAQLINSRKHSEEINQIHLDNALEKMLTENDSSLMRKIAAANNEYSSQASSHLQSYYQDKILNLISTYCYECKRHGENSADSNILLQLIIQLDSRFSKFKLKDFMSHLAKEEEQAGVYFDEDISDDSDNEREDSYQRADGHVTADHPRTKELVDKLEERLRKTLNKLTRNKHFEDDKKYDDFVAEIKQLFSDVETISYKPKHPRGFAAKTVINEDLATVNFYASQGNLEQALKLVSTKFYVAQSRGLHFQIPAWSQHMRRDFRRKVVDGNHPFCDEPLYSMAVYEHAGITDFTDLSELTKLRLEKSDRLIYSRLIKTHQAQPLQNVPNECNTLAGSYQYQTLNQQLQRVYSERQSAFHDIINGLDSADYPFFANNRNPYVSTADIESSHSGRYAYGIKTFAGHENDRLLPDWDNEGRAHRPHSGVIILSLHPLSDYAHKDHNHLVSMNTKGELILQDIMANERETTFFSHIKKDRIKFIVVARYPSFHHQQYLKTFHHLYGLNEQLYYLFRNQILSTKPHSRKRELLRLLLGEYLCAYQKLFLMRKAYDKVGDDVLLYRDRYGNFSLTPTRDVSPTPNGDDDSKLLRRYHTNEIRAPKRIISNNPSSPYRTKRKHCTSSDSEKSDKETKVPRLG